MPAQLVNGFEQFDPVAFEEGEVNLATIFNLQRLLMSACQLENLTPDVAFWVTQNALVDESMEAIENFKDLTKPWKRNTTLDMEHTREEVVDQLFFVVQSAILLGMTAEDFVERYKAKNSKNFQRILEKSGGMEAA